GPPGHLPARGARVRARPAGSGRGTVPGRGDPPGRGRVLRRPLGERGRAAPGEVPEPRRARPARGRATGHRAGLLCAVRKRPRSTGTTAGADPDAVERPRGPRRRAPSGADLARRRARRLDPLAGMDPLGARLPRLGVPRRELERGPAVLRPLRGRAARTSRPPAVRPARGHLLPAALHGTGRTGPTPRRAGRVGGSTGPGARGLAVRVVRRARRAGRAGDPRTARHLARAVRAGDAGELTPPHASVRAHRRV